MSGRLSGVCVVVLVLLPCAAEAGEEASPTSAGEVAEQGRDGEKAKKPPLDHHRLVLGMGSSQLLAGNLGTVGGLAPYVTAGYETRIVGPAWFVLSAQGGIDAAASREYVEGSWSAGGSTGVRLLAPVFDFVEMGGYGLFRGSGGQAQYSDSFSLGLAFGADMHLRPTRFFGVRIGLEVLRLGYSETAYNGERFGAAFAYLTASPSVSLTFSF